MRICWWLGAVVLALSVVTSAQTAVTVRVSIDGANTDVSLSARQIALLSRRLTEVNTERAAVGQSTLTLAQFLRGTLVQALREEEVRSERNEQAEACAAYRALPAPQRNAIDAALGGKSPCF